MRVAIMRQPRCSQRKRHIVRAMASHSPLTHFDAQGQAHMVDVGAKAATHRVARGHAAASACSRATFALIAQGSAKKGDVIGVARIAAIQGAKRTSRADPAVPSAGADARGGRVRARRRAPAACAARVRPRPSAAPASRWKR